MLLKCGITSKCHVICTQMRLKGKPRPNQKPRKRFHVTSKRKQRGQVFEFQGNSENDSLSTMADNPESKPPGDESDDEPEEEHWVLRLRRRQREMRAIENRNLEVNDRPCYRNAGTISFDFDNEEDVSQVVRELREELRVGRDNQSQFKQLVDEILRGEKLCPHCVILGRPTPHHQCGHENAILLTRAAYLDYPVIWQQNFLLRCDSCNRHRHPPFHCHVCRECFRVPELSFPYAVPQHDLDSCCVCLVSENKHFVWKFCMLIRHIVARTFQRTSSYDGVNFPHETTWLMFRIVRSLWNDELSSRFYFDDRDCSPYDNARASDKTWAVWLLSVPQSSMGGFRNYMPLFVRCFRNCLERMAETVDMEHGNTDDNDS